METNSQDTVMAWVLSPFVLFFGAAFAFGVPAMVMILIELPGILPVIVAVGLLTLILSGFVALAIYHASAGFIKLPKARLTLAALFPIPSVLFDIVGRCQVFSVL